ncbi:2TM domain-containing protein [Ramlibacter sp. XY19]|uniref:2TM domain-containing protein n=1 Tax=Ramlibacter paludis TaxID=2908000 RepID=UPI0023DB2469|nr:2TM domain-containing protein [Ramlibacter paludis]MCG2594050.1 2TM domain-containing protein [Ramlibacter paludis]
MPQAMSPEEIETLARKRAGAKMGWYVHACLYVLVNVFMFALSYFGMRGRPWSIYPVLGWGLGLALHGIAVFVLGSGSGLRERLVERERERLQREQDRMK